MLTRGLGEAPPSDPLLRAQLELMPLADLLNELQRSDPKSYQSIVRAAATAVNVEQLARYDARNPQALKRLIANGVQLRPFSQPVMEACLKASNEVNAETSAVNADFKKVLASQP